MGSNPILGLTSAGPTDVGRHGYGESMDLPRGSGRLGERLALGALLITLAGLLWLVGAVGATATTCPAGTAAAGGEAALSAWPPGKECAAAGGETTVQQLFGGIEWGIVGLGLIGVGLLLFAVVAEIRRLRRPARLPRPWTSRSPMSRATSSPRSVTSAAGRPARPSSASG